MTHTLTNPLKKLMLGVVAVAICLAAAQSARANPEVYEKTLRSTAWIRGTKGSGSGVLVDLERRIVVTNYHVVREDSTVLVYFPTEVDGEVMTNPSHYLDPQNQLEIVGTVLSRNVERDLALVEVKSVPKGLKALPLAGKSARPGETVHAIGNSGVRVNRDGRLGGTLWRYSEGKVRQVYDLEMPVKNHDGSTFTLNARVLESQLPTNGGDSGGPVVNDKGELVGITESGVDALRLVTYSVDITEVHTMLAELKNNKDTVKVDGPSKPIETAAGVGAQKPAQRSRETGSKE